jgi:hypothetical protein
LQVDANKVMWERLKRYCASEWDIEIVNAADAFPNLTPHGWVYHGVPY